MSYDYRPTVQAHADAFPDLRDDADRVNPLSARRFEDAMPTPRTFVSTGRCRLACHERPCIEEGSIAAGGQTVSCGVCVRPGASRQQRRPPSPRLPVPVFHRTTARVVPKIRPKFKSERGARNAFFQPYFRRFQRVG